MKLNWGKLASMLLAVTLMIAVLFSGSYAWQMFSQQAKNEVVLGKNPGGRLHDDFNGLDLGIFAGEAAADEKVKTVYVENFTDPLDCGDTIYARIRLDEYMEIGEGAGEATNSQTKKAVSIIAGKEIEKEDEWTPYIWGDTQSAFRKYVTLKTGGETVYLPTYNKDKDSLEADINGTLGGLDRDKLTPEDTYADYEKYIYDAAALEDPDKTSAKWGVELYDANGKGIDELKDAQIKAEEIIDAIIDAETGMLKLDPEHAMELNLGDGKPKLPITADTSGAETVFYIRMNTSDEEAAIKAVVPEKPHTAKRTLCAEEVLTMAEWKKPKNEGGKGGESGPYWVADTDGWIYWAWPIEPGTATGCLLNSISLNTDTAEGIRLFEETYYYGLNVVAQFATANDWGNETDQSGFYASGMTADGKALLDAISAKNESVAIVAPEDGNAVQEAVPGEAIAMSFRLRDASGKETVVDSSRVEWTVKGEEASAVSLTFGVEVRKTGFYDPKHPNVLTIAENETRTSLTVTGCYTDEKGKKISQSSIIPVAQVKYLVTITEPSESNPVTINLGGERQFQADVRKQKGADEPFTATDGTLRWSVQNADDPNAGLKSGTTIGSDGILRVASDETAKNLNVTATYTVKYIDQETKEEVGEKSWTSDQIAVKVLKNLTFPVHTIQKTGNDRDCFVIVIMGDGYTADQQEKFIKDATSRAKGMLNWSPFKDYSDRINIYAVQVESNESGISEYAGKRVDTYFDITVLGKAPQFGTQQGRDRAGALCEELEKEYLDTGASVGTIHILSNVNGAYGGSISAMFSFSAAYSGSEHGEPMTHEIAHSIGNLGDEYGGNQKGRNTSLTVNADEIEWKKLLGFRGVGITNAGTTTLFAPSRVCMMRNTGEEFCEVCKLELARKLNDRYQISHAAPYYLAEPEITIPHSRTGTLDRDSQKYRVNEKNITSANGQDLEFRTVVQNLAEQDLELTVSFRIIGADGKEKYSAQKDETVAGLKNLYDPEPAQESLSVVLEGVAGLTNGDRLEGKVIDKKTGEVLTDNQKADQEWRTIKINFRRLTAQGEEPIPGIDAATVHVRKETVYQLKEIPLLGMTYLGNSLEQEEITVLDDLEITYNYEKQK